MVTVNSEPRPRILTLNDLKTHASSTECWEVFMSRFDPEDPNVKLLIASTAQLPVTLSYSLNGVRVFHDGGIVTATTLVSYKNQDWEHRHLFPKNAQYGLYHLTQAFLPSGIWTRLVEGSSPYDPSSSLR